MCEKTRKGIVSDDAVNALSLFSGIGGMDLVAEACGIQTVAFCECDEFCRSVLKKHWPDVPIYDDVRRLRGEDLGQTVDHVHGGFPCQPFSVAGRQRGRHDDRFLWPEFARLVDEIRPRWVVAENVFGILPIAGDDVCQDMERRGYSVGIFAYEAAAVGCRHRRMRVFFVCHSERGGRDRKHRRRTGQISSDGRWSDKSGLGRVAHGFPTGMDNSLEPHISRTARGIKDRAARLRALGNAVVPAQIYPLFRAIVNADKESDGMDRHEHLKQRRDRLAEDLKEYLAEMQADIDNIEAHGDIRGANRLWKEMRDHQSRLEDIIWKLDKRMGNVK